MLRMVARLSRSARTIPRKSPRTSVTPALSIATSVPVPIAIPTSACRERRRVVDTVAGHRNHAPGLLEFAHDLGLALRQNPGVHLVDPQAARDRLGGDAAIAGQHHDPHAFAARRALSASAAFSLTGSAHADQPRRAAVDRHEHHGLALAPQILGPRVKLGGIDTVVAKHRGVAGQHEVAVDMGAHTFARERAELDRVGEFERARRRRQRRSPRPADAR